MTGRRTATWSPSRAVVGFGVVSLTADMVDECARSVTGPLPATLGASALLVGLVTVAALATGWVDDRVGGRVLLVLPFLVALVPPLAFTRSALLAVVGVLVCGAAKGVQDSSVEVAAGPRRRRRRHLGGDPRALGHNVAKGGPGGVRGGLRGGTETLTTM